MTPAARIAAAIEILDGVLAGQPAEQVLTNWGRRNRFAGSGDRRAIRDSVFDVLRCRRSSLAASGSAQETGRSLMIGWLAQQGSRLDEVFSGARFAPAPLTDEERTGFETVVPSVWTDPVRLDYPDWLDRPLRESLGARFADVMAAQRRRAPIFLRVNLLKAEPDAAISRLAAAGMLASLHPEVRTALILEKNAHRLRQSECYEDGWVELQDAASQATVEFASERLNQSPDPLRCLDYCAGGGGKTLALAARFGARIWAYDAAVGRMKDLPERARRAGAAVTILDARALGQAGRFDLVFVDAPCSGSGAWRRQAEARWRLSPDELTSLTDLQAQILDRARAFVVEGGSLVYATCSILADENERQISAFAERHPDWKVGESRRWWPGSMGDGFFAAHLLRE